MQESKMSFGTFSFVKDREIHVSEMSVGVDRFERTLKSFRYVKRVDLHRKY